MREYSDRVALALLRMHKDSAAQADAEIDATEAGEVAARIVERLRRLRTRDEAAVLETKAASAHLQLIGWALIAARGG